MQLDVSQTINQVTNVTTFYQKTVVMSRRYPIRFICGYKNVPVLNGTTIRWQKDGRPFGTYMTAYSLSYHEAGSFSIDVNPDRRGTTLTILPTTPKAVYGRYFCTITTPAQKFYLIGILNQMADYQVSIIAPNNVTEYQSLTLQCQSNFTLGSATGTEQFYWYRDNQLLLAS